MSNPLVMPHRRISSSPPHCLKPPIKRSLPRSAPFTDPNSPVPLSLSNQLSYAGEPGYHFVIPSRRSNRLRSSPLATPSSLHSESESKSSDNNNAAQLIATMQKQIAALTESNQTALKRIAELEKNNNNNNNIKKEEKKLNEEQKEVLIEGDEKVIEGQGVEEKKQEQKREEIPMLEVERFVERKSFHEEKRQSKEGVEKIDYRGVKLFVGGLIVRVVGVVTETGEIVAIGTSMWILGLVVVIGGEFYFWRYHHQKGLLVRLIEIPISIVGSIMRNVYQWIFGTRVRVPENVQPFRFDARNININNLPLRADGNPQIEGYNPPRL